MKKISVLIPSRGNPRELAETIMVLNNRAKQQDRLEYVVRLDWDDELLPFYMEELDFPSDGPRIVCLVSQPLGYPRIHECYDECYRVSTGDLLLMWGDDVHVQTRGWDVVYEAALANIPFGVASAHVDEGNGTNYPWCMAMVRQNLCDRVGQFCSGKDMPDRIIDAYARMFGFCHECAQQMWSAPKRIKKSEQKSEL